MTEILFYHLQGQKLESVLPALLEKSLERGWKVVVQGSTEERIEALDAHFGPTATMAFSPHGTCANPMRPSNRCCSPRMTAIQMALPYASLSTAPRFPADVERYQRIVLLFDARTKRQWLSTCALVRRQG